MRTSHAPRRFSCLALALSSLLCASGAHASETPSLRVYGGEPAKTCEWPSSVHLEGSCTGTLVHPRIVLYAAHCGYDGPNRKVVFGENARTAHGKTIRTKYCRINPAFKDFAKGEDYAYCLLKEPITEVPIAPIAYGCEIEQIKAGSDIMLAGFGQIDNGSSGTKYKGKSRINKLIANNKEIQIGGKGVATTCYGDSGGPAFFQLSDGSWRNIGIVSYGTNKSCKYPSGLTLAHVAVPWIHKNLKENGVTDIDLLPCYDEDGTWNPKKECTKFPLDHGSSTATWDSMCSEGAKLSGPSTICAPKDEQAPELSWKSPEGGEELEEGSSLEVTIEAQDNSKLNPKVTLWVNDDEQKAIEEPPYRWEVESLEAGSLKLRATAVDAAGNEAKLDAITLTVNPKKEETPEDPTGSPSDSGSESPEKTPTDTSSETPNDESDSGESDSGESPDPNDDDSEQDQSPTEESGQKADGGSRGGCAIPSGGSAPGPWGALALFFAAAALRRSARRSR